jgi:biopolymer transport protein ExbB/TolQ
MALTRSQRPIHEWPLLILALAVVSGICFPIAQGMASDSNMTPWANWDAQRWAQLLIGPAQFLCYCSFTWAAFILISRYLELRRQRRAFQLGILPTEEGARILYEDARPLLRKIDQITIQHGPFILANMIRQALSKYATSRSSQAVSETVRTQAEVDQGRLVASMATVQYLAWAIPAIGFLGTVVGLAGSMSMAGRLSEQDFLVEATGHLTFAFDCTLVALAISLVLMFLVHSIQRDEEALVIDCQQYCLEHLVNRTYEPESLAGNPTSLAPTGGERGPGGGSAVGRIERLAR